MCQRTPSVSYYAVLQRCTCQPDNIVNVANSQSKSESVFFRFPTNALGLTRATASDRRVQAVESDQAVAQLTVKFDFKADVGYCKWLRVRNDNN
jgi:hypothetical protein